MHGMIFIQLQHFIKEQTTLQWDKILQTAKLPPSTYYLMLKTYPDEEIVKIVTAISTMTSIPVNNLLESFGVYLGGFLMRTYSFLINPSWKTLSFIENTEGCIHKMLKSSGSKAAPPELACERVSDTEINLIYSSPRKMCALAIGIAKSVAAHYGEQVLIKQVECMHRGQPKCVINIKLSK